MIFAPRKGPVLRESGFTLIELAIVVFILGMLIAGLIGPVEVQLEARDRRNTIDAMEEAVEALYGYALTNGRLPCSENDGNGVPDPPYITIANATCTSDEGFLPWVELGVGQGDAWGNRFTYRVTSTDFTLPAQDETCNGKDINELDLCTEGNIQINTRGDNPLTPATVEGKFSFSAATMKYVAAVIISHGRNGFGATSVDGVARPAVPASNADEVENTGGAPLLYYQRRYSREQTGCADDTNELTPLCEFDDIVMLVSRVHFEQPHGRGGSAPLIITVGEPITPAVTP